MKAAQPPPEHYIVPARQLSGTRDDVLAQIDELILGLTGLRQLVSMHGPKPAEAPPRKLRLVRGFLKVLLLLGIALWASPVRGQSAAAPTTPTPQQSEGSAVQEQSEDLWRGIVFGATIETFYQYNWNRPPDRVLPLRAYDTRANTFAVQQAALIVDAAPDLEVGRRFGGRVDLQFGMATDTVQGNPANEPRSEAYRHLWQVYGTYVLPAGPNGLQIDAGKYASMLGYETNYAKDNQAFLRAYLFNFLPFYHSGVRLTFPVHERVSLLYMLSNGIQQTEDFNDFKSHHVATVLKPTGRVTWVVNYYFGQEQPDGGEPGGPDGFFKVFDTNLAVSATSRLAFALDVNYVTNEISANADSTSLQGLGAYARYQMTDAAAVGVRYERLDDQGLFGGIDQVLQETTLTTEYRLAEGFLVRAEFRRDWSNEPFFPGRLGGVDLRRGQNTALVGGVWWFGNEPGAW
jgi:Putative beta-barrel porin-2, OmpL-like. bbp2